MFLSPNIGLKLLIKRRPTMIPINIKKLGSILKDKQLKIMTALVQDLGLSYKENLEIMQEMSKDLKNVKKLWRGEQRSKLMKLALTLITFPEPTPISETLGAIVLVAGLIQNRAKKSTLHIEDVYKIFQDVNNDVWKIRQFIS